MTMFQPLPDSPDASFYERQRVIAAILERRAMEN
jgi:hypothetical protein